VPQRADDPTGSPARRPLYTSDRPAILDLDPNGEIVPINIERDFDIL